MDRIPARWKKALIREMRKYPLTWHKKNDDCWDAIYQSLNLPIDKERLRSLWTSLRRYYINLILAKTVAQNNLVPPWEFFHDLVYLYESVKEIVEKKTRLVVPKFLQVQLIDDVIFRCPCCVPREFSVYDMYTDEERMEIAERLSDYFLDEEESMTDSTEEEFHAEPLDSFDLEMFEPIVCIDVDPNGGTVTLNECESGSDGRVPIFH